jgi:uncharacterized membrane protein YdjX (TVP38/TMEM64 family)
MSGRAIKKITSAALVLMLVAIIWGFTPLSHFANPDALAAVMTTISASRWRFAIVLGCFLGAGLVIFPVSLLMVACAAVFGPVSGFFYSTAGLLGSAALNYGIGAWLGREAVSKMLGSRFSSTRIALMRRGLITVAVVRAVPGSPFALFSVAAGASDIRFLDYSLGTAIGVLVPVILLSVATEQALRLLREPSVVDLVVLAGVIAVWIAIAFGAQAVLERIAKGRAR